MIAQARQISVVPALCSRLHASTAVTAIRPSISQQQLVKVQMSEQQNIPRLVSPYLGAAAASLMQSL